MTEIDPARLAVEAAADADLLRLLREQGDVQHLIHRVDVRLIGPNDAIARLAARVVRDGWRVVQVVDRGSGEAAADIQRDQTTDPAAIEALTVEALRLEDAHGVRYDGWGTSAVTEAVGSGRDRA